MILQDCASNCDSELHKDTNRIPAPAHQLPLAGRRRGVQPIQEHQQVDERAFGVVAELREVGVFPGCVVLIAVLIGFACGEPTTTHIDEF